ncbi:MAG: hypothetical protein HZB24_04945 [Desulfobacterales bacterium]|nr:hypothetical protein [Desulfobacterales bacterium]
MDEEIYSLHYFIQLACEGQTVALDMLHAPEPAWIVQSDIWRQIVAQRHRFYTQSLHAFVTYARRQAAKYGIKGSRLNAALQVLAVLQRHPAETRLRQLWDDLPRTEHCLEVAPTPTGLRQYQVCGKAFQETVAVGHVIPILEKFFNDYGQRARLAAQNQEIDWKAVSHALRAAIQIREILTLNTIRYPLADAPFLMAVKAGRLDYAAEVAPALEKLMTEVEALLERSGLPERADTAYWERFICETLVTHRFSHKPG